MKKSGKAMNVAPVADQAQRFKDAARSAQCDNDERAFDQAFKKIVPPKTSGSAGQETRTPSEEAQGPSSSPRKQGRSKKPSQG
jgi:hypothetical protein